MHVRLRSALTHAAAAMIAVGLASTPSAALAQVESIGASSAGAYLAARAASFRYDLVAAARFYRNVFERNPSDIGLAARILSLWVDAGEIDQAVPMAEVVRSADPGYEPARLVLAAAAIKDGNLGLAQIQLEAIAGDSLSDLVTGLLVAWIKFGEGNVDPALTMLDRMSSSGLLVGYHAALIADLDGRTEEALTLMAPIYDPEDSTQRLSEAFARLLARAGFAAEAEEVIRDYLRTVPDHPRLSQLLVQIRAGDPIAPMIENVQQGAAEVFYGLASSMLSRDDYDTATAFLQFARYIGAGSDLPSVLLGQILQAQRRFDEAVRVFDSVEADSPFYVLAAIGASVSDNSRGRGDEAVARLAPIVTADPGVVRAADALAGIYRSQSQYAEANAVLVATIDTIRAFSASNWRLFYARGITFERMGLWSEAEADFFRALTLSPDQPDVLNYLGYSWLERDENYLEALEMIERAVEQRPEAGYIIDSLGWAYYKLGEYEVAVATLELAVELTPNQSDVHEHLGDAYWRAGRTIEAGFQWSHALEYDPEPEAIDRIRDKIDNGLPELPENRPADGVLEIN